MNKLGLAILFTVLLQRVSNQVNANCSTSSLASFIEECLLNDTSRSVIVNFNSETCQSLESCYGDVETTEEFSGDEEISPQLCPQQLLTIDLVHFVLDIEENITDQIIILLFHKEEDFNSCNLENSKFLNISLNDNPLIASNVLKAGVNYLTVTYGDTGNDACTKGSKINITVVSVDCVNTIRNTVCSGHGKCVGYNFKYECSCEDGWDDRYCQSPLQGCHNISCENGGTCKSTNNGYVCMCKPGYSGRFCEIAAACTESTCLHGGTCIEQVTTYLCKCVNAYYGPRCEHKVDVQCDVQQMKLCQNNGTCTAVDGNVRCICKPSFTGDYCETKIDDPCMLQPCENNATCISENQHFRCKCLDGFYGKFCEADNDHCAFGHCMQGASIGCVNIKGGYRCECSYGFTGQNCTMSISDCDNECKNNGTCRKLLDDFVCICTLPFTGHRCEIKIDFCSSNPCKNHSTCIHTADGYACQCLQGQTGKHCDVEIDQCKSNPCRNNGTCLDSRNSYECRCLHGYTGYNCDVNVDLCQEFDCGNGSCEETQNGSMAVCKCDPGFSGEHCQININECKSIPCQNNGLCVDAISGYTCYCVNGYAGKDCSDDINECSSNPCFNNGTCLNYIGGFNCTCSAGFSGILCNEDIILCDISAVCKNNGTCFEIDSNTIACDCSLGYTGQFCEIEIDKCDSHPCLNNATCLNEDSSYICICGEGYSGVHCENEINECLSYPCENHGICNDMINGYECGCASGFTGPKCSKISDFCIAYQPCTNNATCTSGEDEYHCECLSGFTGTNCSINIDDCFNNDCNVFGTMECVDGIDNYTCVCLREYHGSLCEKDMNECLDNMCTNGGTCVNMSPGFRCECMAGYVGKNCNVNINECLSNPCAEDNAVCVDKINSFVCYCRNGFAGERCEIELNECISTPCQHESTCIDLDAHYHCECTAGFTGINCEIDINECESNPCKNNARCQDHVNGFYCSCLPGYTSDDCGTEIDECLSNPCFRGGTCFDLIGRFQCICPFPYKGDSCELLPCDDPSPCYNQATCTNVLDNSSDAENKVGFHCECLSGFEGIQCITNINECSSNPCNGGHCIDGVNGFICLCPPGFAGVFCNQPVNNCQENECENGGKCIDLLNSFKCQCMSGWTGEYCEREIDECVVYEPCQNSGKCIDKFLDYQCICEQGFDGKNCSENTNECRSNPCLNGGMCKDLINNYICSCSPLFTGIHCETAYDPCSYNNNICKNGATCGFSEAGEVICQCINGYSGHFCEINVDECFSNPCLNGARCRDGIGGFFCHCPAGFDGNQCETETDVCASLPCSNSGTCIVSGVTFTCFCKEGFTGPTCDIDVNECMKGHACLNGGTCTNLYGSYNCQCARGYYGDKCEKEKDECLSVPCMNGGTCKDFIGYFTCSCKEGFKGKICQINIDDCIISQCHNASTCLDLIAGYKCICPNGWTGTYCDVKVNKCLSNPCYNEGTCVDRGRNFACTCQTGFTGSFCEFDVNICNDEKTGKTQCQNNGTCLEGFGLQFECMCLDGFSGQFCEVDIDECLSWPCLNNSTCINLPGTFTCSCLPGFSGMLCDIEINACESNPCLNEGKCIKSGDEFRCYCKPGFQGVTCEYQHDNCWMNPCLHGGTCISFASSFYCNCSEGFKGRFCNLQRNQTGSANIKNLQNLTNTTTNNKNTTLLNSSSPSAHNTSLPVPTNIISLEPSHSGPKLPFLFNHTFMDKVYHTSSSTVITTENYASLLSSTVDTTENYAFLLSSTAIMTKNYASLMSSTADTTENYAFLLSSTASMTKNYASLMSSTAITTKNNYASLLQSKVTQAPYETLLVDENMSSTHAAPTPKSTLNIRYPTELSTISSIPIDTESEKITTEPENNTSHTSKVDEPLPDVKFNNSVHAVSVNSTDNVLEMIFHGINITSKNETVTKIEPSFYMNDTEIGVVNTSVYINSFNLHSTVKPTDTDEWLSNLDTNSTQQEDWNTTDLKTEIDLNMGKYPQISPSSLPPTSSSHLNNIYVTATTAINSSIGVTPLTEIGSMHYGTPLAGNLPPQSEQSINAYSPPDYVSSILSTIYSTPQITEQVAQFEDPLSSDGIQQQHVSSIVNDFINASTSNEEMVISSFNKTVIDDIENSFSISNNLNNVTYDWLCSDDTCKNGATCIQLSKESTCLCAFGWKGKYCENVDKSVNMQSPYRFFGEFYNYSSYLQYPILPGIHYKTEIRIKFLYKNKDNLLLYLGTPHDNSTEDYLKIAMKDGHVYLMYNLGGGPFLLVSKVHVTRDTLCKIHVIRKGRFSSLTVNQQEPVEGFSRANYHDLNFPSTGHIYVGGFNKKPTITSKSSNYSSNAISLNGSIFSIDIKVFEHSAHCWRNKAIVDNGRWVDLLHQTVPLSGRTVTACNASSVCEANPCENNSTCLTTTSSAFKCMCDVQWVGTYCDKTRHPCDTIVCHNGGTCTLLNNGQTYCSCLLGWKGDNCIEVAVISDPGFNATLNSWMGFSPINIRRETDVKIQFKTYTDNGLLFYVADETKWDNCDFLSISLNDRFVELRFSLGPDSLLVLQHPLLIEHAVWHQVTGGRLRNKGYLEIKNIEYPQHNNEVMKKKIADTDMTSLDANSDFYVGGHPRFYHAVDEACAANNTGFTGCIRELIVNNLSYNLDHDQYRSLQPDLVNDDLTATIRKSGASITDCEGNICGYQTCYKRGTCREDLSTKYCECVKPWVGYNCDIYELCKSACNNSTCTPQPALLNRKCECGWGWQGDKCNVKLQRLFGDSALMFDGRSYARFDSNVTVNKSENFVEFYFKTWLSDGMIIWFGNPSSSEKDHLSAGLFEGRLKISVQLGYDFDHKQVNTTTQMFNDNHWHFVEIRRFARKVTVFVDGTRQLQLQIQVSFKDLNDDDVIHVGGFGHRRSVHSRSFGIYRTPYVGCIRNINVDNSALLWNEAIVTENLNLC